MNTKPYVQAATVCEKILLEPDNVASLIRMVDAFHINLEEPRPNAEIPLGVEFQLFVSLKSGDVVGDFKLGLQLIRPNGGREKSLEIPVNFKGGGHGSQLRIKAVITNPSYGLYWFELTWGGEVLTRVPLDIRPIKQQPQASTPEL